jgi:hypothetical protein
VTQIVAAVHQFKQHSIAASQWQQNDFADFAPHREPGMNPESK